MAYHDDDINKLERALAESYRSRSDLAFDAVDVGHEVMRDIRRSTGMRRSRAPVGVLDQLVWRTAAITAAVALTMAVLTVGLLRPQIGESQTALAEEFESVTFGD